jgi:GR25 family glycosyltransferase involved in LPS biosynthesis
MTSRFRAIDGQELNINHTVNSILSSRCNGEDINTTSSSSSSNSNDLNKVLFSREYLFPSSLKISDCMNKFIGRNARIGEIGCMLSHLCLIRWCAIENKDIMVFEDDIEFFEENFEDELSMIYGRCLPKESKDCDILYFGWLDNEDFYKWKCNENLQTSQSSSNMSSMSTQSTSSSNTQYSKSSFIKNNIESDPNNDFVFSYSKEYPKIPFGETGGGLHGYILRPSGARKIFYLLEKIHYNLFWPIDYLLLAFSHKEFMEGFLNTKIPEEKILHSLLVKKRLVSVTGKDTDIQKTSFVKG